MSEIIKTTPRDIDTVTVEINTIKKQTQQILLTAAIEIGRRLVEVKSMVPHGEWGKYLEEKVEYSQSTANNLMKLYEEYGSDQHSLFETFANSQAFGKLTYTKALALLAVPAEERETFVDTHDVEGMSTRELQDAIREERDELQKKLTEAQEVAEDLREDLDDARSTAEDAQQQLTKAEEEKTRAEKSEKAALEKVKKLEEQLEKAKAEENAARDALKKSKENPEIPEAVMEQMRQQIIADAAKSATEDLQKKLDAAQSAAQAAERIAQEAKEKLAAAEKTAKMQNPDVAVFQSLYIQLQETWNRAVGAYQKVQQTDDASAINCHRALTAMIQKFQGDIANH